MIGPAKVLVYLLPASGFLLISSQPVLPRCEYHRLVQIYDDLCRDPTIVFPSSGPLVCTPQVH